MPAKFATFAEALAALCRQHHVAVAPTADGRIGVWDVSEGDAPVDGLADCTAGQAEPAVAARDLPDYFLTILAAREFPGYVRHEITHSMATSFARMIEGAEVVPIGPPKHVRSWAVIKPPG